MLLQRAMIVWVMAATALPVVATYADEELPAAPSPAIESSAPEPAPSVLIEDLQFDAKPTGLTYKVEVPAAAPQPDDFRFNLAQRPAPEAALWFSPVAGASRTGWAASGRVGPVRWLSPFDGEGETKMRLWGRVPGQPRTPGMGHYNIIIQYTFE